MSVRMQKPPEDCQGPRSGHTKSNFQCRCRVFNRLTRRNLLTQQPIELLPASDSEPREMAAPQPRADRKNADGPCPRFRMIPRNPRGSKAISLLNFWLLSLLKSLLISTSSLPPVGWSFGSRGEPGPVNGSSNIALTPGRIPALAPRWRAWLQEWCFSPPICHLPVR